MAMGQSPRDYARPSGAYDPESYSLGFAEHIRVAGLTIDVHSQHAALDTVSHLIRERAHRNTACVGSLRIDGAYGWQCSDGNWFKFAEEGERREHHRGVRQEVVGWGLPRIFERDVDGWLRAQQIVYGRLV